MVRVPAATAAAALTAVGAEATVGAVEAVATSGCACTSSDTVSAELAPLESVARSVIVNEVGADGAVHVVRAVVTPSSVPAVVVHSSVNSSPSGS